MFTFRLNRRQNYHIIHADSKKYMQTLPENSVDSIVTDIPYAIGLMKKAWDRQQAPMTYQLWNESWAIQAYRILKPGAHMIVFMSPVTMHRAVCGIEDAGFEIRDLCLYLHSMGFNHGYDQGQCIEKLLKTGQARRPDRELGLTRNRWNGGKKGLADTGGVIELTYEQAIKWSGWNTTLKPCMEPCYVFRKPLSEKNVAQNILRWGTGALNTQGCRIQSGDNKRTADGSRHPGNILHDGVLTDGLARFFYCAKSHRSEKNLGGINTHPSVKPLALTQYFLRLVTPPGGLVLDPFAGSFTTGLAAQLENVRFTGVEQDPEYIAIGKKRMQYGHVNLETIRAKYGIH